MRLYNFLNEKYLPGEITFGFELEGYDSKSESGVDPDIQLIELMKKYKFFGEIKDDQSLDYNNDEDYPGNPFEFASHPLNFTPENIIKFKNLLLNLKKEGIITNEKCGFHMHFKFPQMDFADQAWIVANLSIDNEAINKFSNLNNYKFFDNEFATIKFLKPLKDSLRNKNLKEIKYYLSTEKRRIIRIHPQGTIEWRGPRNFLNKGKIEDILNFINLVNDFTKWMRNTLDKNQIYDISKEEFNKLFDRNNVKYDKISYVGIIEHFYEMARNKLKTTNDYEIYTLAIKMITSFLNSHKHIKNIKHINLYERAKQELMRRKNNL